MAELAPTADCPEDPQSLRDQALAAFIPDDQMSPALRAAVDDLILAAPGRLAQFGPLPSDRQHPST